MTQRHILLAAILPLIAFAAHAQTLRDRIPPNGASLRIERSADLPASYVAALRRANCLYDDAMLFAFSIELFRPAAGAQLMMIVPCSGVTLHGRAFLIDPAAPDGLRPLVFPMMALPGRATASETPGLLSWDPRTRTLVAVQGNDTCDGLVARHTYRYDDRRGGDDFNGFALAKVERAKLGCFGARENWETVWDAR